MKIISRGFALRSTAAIKIDIRTLNMYEFIQKKKYIKRRRNLCSIEPEIYIFKFSSSWRRSEAREKRKFLRLPTNSRLNFRRRMTTEGSIPHVIFYRKWLSFVDRWKFASPRNLQLPKIRLEKYNLSSLGVFYREHFIRCFLKDHKFRKFTPSIRDNSRSQIVRDWSPFNSRVSVDDSRRKLTRGRERRKPATEEWSRYTIIDGKISCDRRRRIRGTKIRLTPTANTDGPTTPYPNHQEFLDRSNIRT